MCLFAVFVDFIVCLNFIKRKAIPLNAAEQSESTYFTGFILKEEVISLSFTWSLVSVFEHEKTADLVTD